MSRRLAVPVLVVTLLAAAAVASYWGIPRTALNADPDDADHLTLYQNGLAAIRLVRPFEAVGGDQVLTISLPTTTIFDSLTVAGDGVVVREMRSSLAADPALRPGDRLVVRTDDGARLEGTFQAQDGDRLLLSKEDGTVVVQLSHVVAVEVSGRRVDPSGPGSTSVQVLVRAEPGPRTVRVSYLAMGSGWSPSYILDPGTGAMTFFATLTGMQDWRNVTLDLVAGNPNVVYTPSPYAEKLHFDTDTFAMGGAGASAATSTYSPPFEPSQALGALHRYRHQGTVDLETGQTVRLPLVTGRVEVLRHYYRADMGPHSGDWQALPEVYQIRNTLGEQLPAGPVRVYLDGEWIGADNLPALGKTEQGNVTVAVSDEVKARVVQESQSRADPTFPDPNPYGGQRRGVVKVTTVHDFQVRNLGDAGVDLRASFQAGEGGTTRVLDVRPAPDLRDRGARVWDDGLDAGETLHYRVTIETTEEQYYP